MARAGGVTRRALALLALLAFLVPLSGRTDDADPVRRLEERLRKAEESWGAIRGYSCTILMQETRKGKPRGLETVACRFRKPNSVYLEWLPPGPFAGLRVSFVQGRDAQGTFLGHEAGFAGLLGVKRYRFAGNFVQTFYPHYYAPEQTNVGFVIRETTERFRKAAALGKILIVSDARAADPYLKREMDRVEAVLSSDPADGLGYRRVVYYFDLGTQLPLHMELYDYQDRLQGQYVFSEFTPGVEIPDGAFDLK